MIRIFETPAAHDLLLHFDLAHIIFSLIVDEGKGLGRPGS
jgi:hypothetical protein